jgi:hypothetical protein
VPLNKLSNALEMSVLQARQLEARKREREEEEEEKKPFYQKTQFSEHERRVSCECVRRQRQAAGAGDVEWMRYL